MRILTVRDCFQCRYGCEPSKHNNGEKIIETFPWCHEAEREIPDMNIIPEWCPLPKTKSKTNEQILKFL